MLTFSRLGKSLQQDDAEAEHSGLVAEDIACNCCVLAEAGMVLLAFLWGPGDGKLLPQAAFCFAGHVPQGFRGAWCCQDRQLSGVATHRSGPNGCSAGTCPQGSLALLAPGSQGPGSCCQLPAVPGSRAAPLAGWVSLAAHQNPVLKFYYLKMMHVSLQKPGHKTVLYRGLS